MTVQPEFWLLVGLNVLVLLIVVVVAVVVFWNQHSARHREIAGHTSHEMRALVATGAHAWVRQSSEVTAGKRWDVNVCKAHPECAPQRVEVPEG